MARPIPPLAKLLDITHTTKLQDLFDRVKLAIANEGFTYRIHDGTEAGGRVRYRCDRAGSPKTKTTDGKAHRNRNSKRCSCKHAISLVKVLGTTVWKLRIDHDQHNHLNDGTPIAAQNIRRPTIPGSTGSEDAPESSRLLERPQSSSAPLSPTAPSVHAERSMDYTTDHMTNQKTDPTTSQTTDQTTDPTTNQTTEQMTLPMTDPATEYRTDHMTNHSDTPGTQSCLESPANSMLDNATSTSSTTTDLLSTPSRAQEFKELAIGGERIQGSGPWADFAIVRDILANDVGTEWEPYPWPQYDPSGSKTDAHDKFLTGSPLICKGKLQAMGASYPEGVEARLLEQTNEAITILDGSTRTYETLSLHDCVNRFLRSDPMDTPFGLLDYQINDPALSSLIVPPDFCRSLDWTARSWALAEVVKMGRAGWRVNDMRSVQLTTPGLYTDFHVDSGNSSSWFHLAKGHKCLLVALPTEANRIAFQQWEVDGRKQWLGNVVDHLYKIDVQSGDTVIWNGGLIHAVITYEPSVVFTGSFVHEFNLRDQIDGWWDALGDEAWQIPLFPRLCVLYAKHLLKIPKSQRSAPLGVDLSALCDFLSRLALSGRTCDKHVGRSRRREIASLSRRLRTVVRAEASASGV